MSRMVRKQVYIEPEQDALLKQRSREIGVTEAELIRRGIDSLMTSTEMLEASRRKAWECELAFMKSRIDPQAAQRTRSWNRQEIYDDLIGKSDPD